MQLGFEAFYEELSEELSKEFTQSDGTRYLDAINKHNTLAKELGLDDPVLRVRGKVKCI